MLEVKLQGQSGGRTTGTNRPSSCLRRDQRGSAWKTSQTSVRNQCRDWETGGVDVFTRFKTKEILRIDQETQRLMPASICESLMKVRKSHTHKNKPTRTKETEN